MDSCPARSSWCGIRAKLCTTGRSDIARSFPDLGSIEESNISVGWGTDAPFERVGAPWVNAIELAQTLNARQLGGVRFYPVEFTPASNRYAGERCGGVHLIVTNRRSSARFESDSKSQPRSIVYIQSVLISMRLLDCWGQEMQSINSKRRRRRRILPTVGRMVNMPGKTESPRIYCISAERPYVMSEARFTPDTALRRPPFP